MRIRSLVFSTALALCFAACAYAENKFDLLAARALTPETEKVLSKQPAGKAGFAVFFSVSDGEERAVIRHGTGPTLPDAWNKAVNEMQAAMKENGLTGKWVKADIVKESMKISFADFSQEIRDGGVCMYRRGVAFDEDFKDAFIEENLNGTNAYIGRKNGGLNMVSVVNDYFEKTPVIPDSVYTFSCVKFFCDENSKVYKLTDSGVYHGRREFAEVTGEDARNMVFSAGRYLLATMNEDGRFRYCVYPQKHRLSKHYNLLRHNGAVWALIRMCRLAGTWDDETKQKIDKGMDYMLSCVRYKDSETAYMYEAESQEIKLGSNGLAIVAFTEYMDLFKTDKFTDVCRKLGNGILELLDLQTGKYYHVLNKDFTRKEPYRIVYYDGEASFGLCRLYELTKDKKYLDAVERAVGNFIREDYTKYADHWIGYTMAALVKHACKPEYVEFGFRNAVAAFTNGEKYLSATTMEVLTQGMELYNNLVSLGYHSEFFDSFNISEFSSGVINSMSLLVNRYFYPELAMYMAKPDEVCGTFMVRHKWFRMRVDDVQHNMSGVYTYAVNYDSMKKYQSLANTLDKK